jgi:poly(3-hydroxyalkanoate) synthetase
VKTIKMYKIQWINHTKEEATRETEDYLRKYYVDLLPKEVGT